MGDKPPVARTTGKIRTNDPAGMRSRIVDVATRTFQSNGYNATSILDILRTSGVSPGALHHHFPTKRHLIEAVLRERIAVEVDDTWARAMLAAPSAIEGIVWIFEQVADALDAQGSVSGCPLGNIALELSRSDEALRALIGQEYDKWRSAIVEKRRNTGESSDDDDDFATTVVALFTGAMSLAKVAQSGVPLRRCASQLKAFTASLKS